MERKSQQNGRWPANVLLDEDAAAALDAASGERAAGYRKNPSTKYQGDNTVYGDWQETYTCGERGYPDTGGASRFFYCAKSSRRERNLGLEGMLEREPVGKGFNGGNFHDLRMEHPQNRNPVQNHHPTVKPLALMRYLCRLTKTPTGGVVLDPFMGSGTTGMAAVMEGRDFIGIELDADYLEIARRRIAAAAEAARQLELPLTGQA